MSDTLSIILPVNNAVGCLSTQVEQLLEIAAELTDQFELLIVDDASSDGTNELADDLSRMYPQVRYIRRREKLGVIPAAKLGIRETVGEVVLIHDVESTPSSASIQEFWAMRGDDQLVFARSEDSRDRAISVAEEQRRSVTAWSGTQMLRRRAIHDLQISANPPSRLRRAGIDRVTRTDPAAPPGSAPVFPGARTATSISKQPHRILAIKRES